MDNAGIRCPAPLPDTTADAFDHHFATNARAASSLVGAVAPHMTGQGSGAIVNVLTSGVTGACGPVRGAGIRVNAVAPGPTRTPALAQLPGEVIDALGRMSALGRIGEPAEVAEAVAFLAGDRAGCISGAVPEVCGGAAPVAA